MKGQVRIGQSLYKEQQLVGERYRLIRTIGKGGMGVVYEARDERLGGARRAIKIVTAPLVEARGDGSIISARREWELLRGLQHPHIAELLDFLQGEQAEELLLVMTYVDGITLEQQINEGEQEMSLAELCQIGLQLCSALAYLHNRQPPIIHRDLKPSNVMIDVFTAVKLIDFGISRSYKRGQSEDTELLGTIGFVAPELMRGQQSDPRTDLYGLGCVLYYAATNGEVYLPFDTRESTLANIELKLQNRFPQQFTALLADLLSQQMNDRPRAAEVVAERLRQLEKRITDGRLHSASSINSYAPNVAEEGRGTYAKQRGRRGSGVVNGERPVTRCHTVGVVGLAPGAGATFITLALAQLLAEQQESGERTIGIELPMVSTPASSQPHTGCWQRLLPPADERRPAAALSSALPGWAQRTAGGAWLAYPCQPAPVPASPLLLMQRLQDWMTAAGEPCIAVIDWAAGWDDASLEALLRCDTILAVAHPYAGMWAPERLGALRRLEEQLAASGRALHWIANMDTRFKNRRRWLELFPNKPIAIVPALPTSIMLQAHWQGKMPASLKPASKVLDAALSGVMRHLLESNTK